MVTSVTAAKEDLMTIDGRLRTGVNDTELTRRALQVVLDKPPTWPMTF